MGFGIVLRVALLTAAVVFLHQPAASAATDSALPVLARLIVHETAGQARAAAPVTGGVALERGAHADATDLHVVDDGRSIPVQARVTSRWPDGTARWLLVDWQTDARAKERRSVVLRRGPAPSTTASLKVVESAAGVVVDTSVLRLHIPTEGVSLFSQLSSKDERVVQQVQGFARIDAQAYRTSGMRVVTVLERGRWRTRISVAGRYGPFHYTVRLDLFAGKSFVRVLHTFENHGPQAAVSLEEIGLSLPMEIEGGRYVVGVEGYEPLAREIGTEPVRFEQVDAHRFRVDGRERNGRLNGRLAITGERSGLALAGRFFWQEFPQSLTVAADGVTYSMRSLGERPAQVGTGAAKTHELMIRLPVAGRLEGDLPSQPLMLTQAPESLSTTGALRNAAPPGRDLDRFLRGLETSFRRFQATQAIEEWDDSGVAACREEISRKRVGAFGMFNFGDWNFPGFRDNIKGCDAWGNLEYDTTQVLALGFATTGSVAYREAMTASARHFMDVDRIHFSAKRPTWVGMNHPKNPLHFTFELGGVDLGHVWNEGLITYGLLTGDERALQAALEIADYLVRRRRDGVLFRGNPRQWGWPQIALVAAYELSAEERYREAALWYARRGMNVHAATGIGSWKLAILAEGLAYTHSVSGDKAVLAWLNSYAGAVASGGPKDSRFYPALAYAGRVAGNEAWRSLARKKAATLRFGAWGKPFTIGGRTGFAILGTPH